MANLFELLDQPLFTRIGLTLVHSVWQGAAIALLLATTLLALRRASASARYLAACGAMILVLACVTATLTLLPHPSRAPVAAKLDAPILIETPIRIAPLAPVGHAPLQPTLWQRVEHALPWLSAAWVIGVIGCAIRHLGGWLHLKKLRRDN